jgi:coenzyme PQQ precursor peptide PqqA
LNIFLGGKWMAWKKPTAVEISCGMEINMYGPGEDDERSGDDLF